MPITINGAPLNDGDPLLVNGVQAQAVTVNGTQVWRNTVPPSAIQNLTATANRVEEILVTFTHSTGVPTPQHDLYVGGVLAASNISSGYIHSISDGTYSLFVRAHNSAGTIDSNTVQGIALPTFHNIIDTMANDAIGTTQANHTMDSGHRWTEGVPSVPATIQSYGGSSNGRGLYNNVNSGGSAQVGGIVIPRVGDITPDNYTSITRYDYSAGALSALGVLLQKSESVAGVTINVNDLGVSTDPSTIVLRTDGNIAYQVVIPDPPSGQVVPIIITLNVTPTGVSGNVNVNGTNYNIPVRSRTAGLLPYMAYTAVVGLIAGTVSMSEFRITKN